MLSAFARRRRERSASEAALSRARREALAAWAADALQLGAAVVAAGGRQSDLEFVTLDDRQAEAAAREGFRVLSSS